MYRRLSRKIFLTSLNPLPRRWLRLIMKILKIIVKKILTKLMSSKRTTQSFFINLLKMMSQKMKRLKKETRNLCLVGALRAQTPSKVQSPSKLRTISHPHLRRARPKIPKMRKRNLLSLSRVSFLRAHPKVSLKSLLPIKRAKMRKTKMNIRKRSFPKIYLLLNSQEIYHKAKWSKRVNPMILRWKSQNQSNPRILHHLTHPKI